MVAAEQSSFINFPNFIKLVLLFSLGSSESLCYFSEITGLITHMGLTPPFFSMKSKPRVPLPWCDTTQLFKKDDIITKINNYQ